MRLRRVFWSVALTSMLLVYGCGGDAAHTGDTANQYPAGVSEDIEKQLKYDARVDSFEPEDENLIVNVNEAWVNAPQGMQEHAVGQWYSLWHEQHTGKVIVRYDGNPVASWSGEGYKPEKAKGSESEGEADSES